MENSVGVSDADVAAGAAPAENPVTTATGSPKSGENDLPSATAEETKTSAVHDESVAGCGDVVATKAAADDKNRDGNSAAVEIGDLNEAMASTSISTSRPDDIEQSQGEDISNEQQTPVTVTEKENVIVDSTNVESDVSVKTPQELDEEANSTAGGFEDAREYIDDEEDPCVEQDQNNVTHQDRISAAESCGDEELLDDDEVVGEEGEETAASVPAVPVPVDDDTNDPQYIPRRGRFYEHDDRMAYSTTSSEASESENGYEYDSGDEDGENSDRRRTRRRRTSSKRGKSAITGDVPENNSTAVEDGSVPSKKVLAISKVAALTTKDSSEASVTSAGGSAKKPGAGSRKTRDIDSLDKWTHDMYDEREQTRKSRDELMVSYGYDIREESEAPRARRHHKYGRAATAKYTRNWQDTKAYTGAGGAQQSSKVKRGGLGRVGGPNKNKNKSATSDEYTSEFPALENAKPSESTSSEVPVVAEASGQQLDQQAKSPTVPHQEKKTVPASTATGPSRHHAPPSRSFTKHGTSHGNRNHHQDFQNGGQTSFSSSHSKNFFNRPSADSPISKEKVQVKVQVNRENTSGAANYYNRKPQQHSSGQNPHHNFKQQNFNSSQGGQVHNQHHQHSSSASHRGRNFHQHHNNQQQYNRDRYFSKGSLPSSSNSNQHQYEQTHHNNVAHTTAGTGRTQHGGGNYHHFSNRQYENENESIEQSPVQPAPVVRSSKRYSVQSRRELPDPVLNFGGMSKTPQPQQQTPVTQHQQPNGMVMQDQQQTSLQQMQPSPQQLQQQQPIQMHQQQPPPMQIQQYHQPIQQIHPHHGMVLDHNTGMMVMAATDPSIYHHQLYAAPQYATTVPPGSSTGGTDDQAVAAAAALQMLAAQAAVYQPVPTGATGLTSPPSGSQSLQQQQSETFMTTYYQPQQQTQQQPPPRRVNLAIPIVAPPPEPNQQQGPSKTNLSPTPPPAATAAGVSSN